jgi:hypothetical protein
VALANELHRKMLFAAKSFGYPQGWPAQERFADADRDRILEMLPPTCAARRTPSSRPAAFRRRSLGRMSFEARGRRNVGMRAFAPTLVIRRR